MTTRKENKLLKQIFSMIPNLYKVIIGGVIVSPILGYIVLQYAMGEKIEFSLVNIGVLAGLALIFSVVAMLVAMWKLIVHLNAALDLTPVAINTAFIAAPMKAPYNAGQPESFPIIKEYIAHIQRLLKRHCELADSYYAGQDMDSIVDFHTPEKSLRLNIDALKQSEFFILVLMKEIGSRSALVETGFALALKKKSIFFVHEDVRLPFMLQNIESAYPNVRILRFSETNDVENIIMNNHSDLFSFEKIS